MRSLLIAVVVALAACGGGHASLGQIKAAPCSEVFAEGAQARFDKYGKWDGTCTADGTTYVGAYMSDTCPDGSKLFWQDRGWLHTKDNIVHAGKLDLDGDGQFTGTDIERACQS